MIEIHPFENFVPQNAEFLILGSFAGRQAFKGTGSTEVAYDWFYGTKRNQFWPILEEVYGIKLRDKQSKQDLLADLRIAIADIIYKCERMDGNNLDSNLTNIEYNKDKISEILVQKQIEKIFFTSRFVELKFKKVFKDIIESYPDIDLVTLPSPSPRYVRISREQKKDLQGTSAR